MAYRNILNPIKVDSAIRNWLEEDGSFDYSMITLENVACMATLTCKKQCTLAGLPFVEALCATLNCTMITDMSDGEEITTVPATILRISGPAVNLLRLERIAINILSWASGIATQSAKMVAKVAKLSWKGVLAGSQKTTPGFKMVEKYAMLVGGADPHSYDFSSMIVIKSNHQAISGSLSELIKETRKNSSFSAKVEVECTNEKQGLEAVAAGADIIKLDNLTVKSAKEAATNIKSKNKNVLIEVSGSITELNVINYCSPSIDIISTNALHQNFEAIDFGLAIEKFSDEIPFIEDTVKASNGALASTGAAKTTGNTDSSTPAKRAVTEAGDAVDAKKVKKEDASGSTKPKIDSPSTTKKASPLTSAVKPRASVPVTGFRGYPSRGGATSSTTPRGRGGATSSSTPRGRGGSSSHQRGGSGSGDNNRAAFESRRPPPYVAESSRPPILAAMSASPWSCRMCGTRNPPHARPCMRCGSM